MPVRYILSIVWVRLSISSVIHYTMCGTLCFQFTHFPRDDRDYIYLLSSSIGSMNYYPLFRVRSWNNDMRCVYIFLSFKVLCSRPSFANCDDIGPHLITIIPLGIRLWKDDMYCVSCHDVSRYLPLSRHSHNTITLIARFMGQTWWAPSGPREPCYLGLSHA